jgi:hypothetical protein
VRLSTWVLPFVVIDLSYRAIVSRVVESQPLASGPWMRSATIPYDDFE